MHPRPRQLRVATRNSSQRRRSRQPKLTLSSQMAVGSVQNVKTIISEAEKNVIGARKLELSMITVASLFIYLRLMEKCHQNPNSHNRPSYRRIASLRILRSIPIWETAATVQTLIMERPKQLRKPQTRRILWNKRKIRRRMLLSRLVTGLATDATISTTPTEITASNATSSMTWTRRWVPNWWTTALAPKIQALSQQVHPLTTLRWITRTMYLNRPWCQAHSTWARLILRWKNVLSTSTSTSIPTKCQASSNRCNRPWCLHTTLWLSRTPHKPTLLTRTRELQSSSRCNNLSNGEPSLPQHRITRRIMS